jgi:hypothetical protein
MLYQPSAKAAKISIFTIVHHQRRHSAAFRNAVFIISVVDSISVVKILFEPLLEELKCRS